MPYGPGLCVSAWLLLAAAFPITVAAPSEPTAWMQVVIATLGLATLLATILKSVVDMRYAREQRAWREEDHWNSAAAKVERERIERKTDVQTQIIAEVARNGAGVPKPGIEQLLSIYDDLNPRGDDAGPQRVETPHHRAGPAQAV